MSADNRRQADRLPVVVPLELDTRTGTLQAESGDVSRTGMRLFLRASALGFVDTTDMALTAAKVAAAFSPRFDARLHYEMLGSLLQRGARMTRLSIPPARVGWIEIGCQFDVPLSAEDTTVLGVPMPPVSGSDEAFCPRADVPAPYYRAAVEFDLATEVRRTPEPEPEPDIELMPPEPEEDEGDTVCETSCETVPRREDDTPRPEASAAVRYRAFVTGTRYEEVRPLICKSDYITPESVRLRVPREGYEGDDAACATVRFTERYGNEIGLRLVDGAEHLWTGPARVFSVEAPADADSDLLVTLAFGRTMRSAELARLGLRVEAA